MPLDYTDQPSQCLLPAPRSEPQAAPGGPERSKTAQKVAGIQGYEAQKAALSPNRAVSCQKATATAGRNEWLATRGTVASAGAMSRLMELESSRSTICDPAVPMSDSQAEMRSAYGADLVRTDERMYQTGKCDDHAAIDGHIRTANGVRDTANFCGSVAEGTIGMVAPPLGAGLGAVRRYAGDIAEEEASGDGYDAADFGKSTLNYVGDRALKAGIGAVLPSAPLSAVGRALMPAGVQSGAAATAEELGGTMVKRAAPNTVAAGVKRAARGLMERVPTSSGPKDPEMLHRPALGRER